MLIPGIKATTTTTGTGAITLSAVTGYPLPSAVLAVGMRVPYCLVDGDNREWGVGQLTATEGFVRESKIAKYDSGVYSTYPATGISLSGSGVVFSIEDIGTQGGGHYLPDYFGITAGNRNGVFGLTNGATLVTVALAVDSHKLAVFTVPRPMRIRKLGIRVTTGVAGNARIGMYQAGFSAPETAAKLVAETVDLSTTSAAVVSDSTVNFVLWPGCHYFASVNSDATATIRSVAAGAAMSLGTDGGSANNTTASKNGVTYGAMPSTIDLSSYGVNTATPPAIYYEE